MNEAEVSLHLTNIQKNELFTLLYENKEAFAKYKEPLGEIMGHQIDIILIIERPYPPLLRRPTSPESLKSRESLDLHLKALLDLGVIRKVGHIEEVETTAPFIVAWHNGKSKIVGDFRALRTYTFPYRYPIPKIQISFTQISQAIYINIIFINNTSVCSKTWEENMYLLSRVLGKIQSVKMKISLKKCHFGFKELKALGHVVSGLSLGIGKNNVSEVLLKPIPQKKKGIH
ncbi:hypothetical protein O181_053317 [Austropuccinia psidii MF-1]|uniref:Uncharacterized protein n=1 Tax=Austropuccinia psidii MF-1 TaxID=1389203 RepID=A0A9Q3E9F0_9BASI|nr:hypothetical protein [Austropuccinia psidii MF-1]